VAAIFVEVEERQIERDLLHEIGLLRAEVQELRALIQARREPGALKAPAAKASVPSGAADVR
jgi:hypothetical protein